MRSIPVRFYPRERGLIAIGHMIKPAPDKDSNLTLLSVDGIGAYDHTFRASESPCHFAVCETLLCATIQVQLG